VALDSLIVIAFIVLAVVIGVSPLTVVAALGGGVWLCVRAHHYGLISLNQRE
jgi:hypothetical protein